MVLFTVVSLLVLFFRLVDEVLFFDYRKVDIKKPVFIISNPRSGTTFLHRLMCLDSNRYAYTKLFHTILPSITLFKIFGFIGAIDEKIGSPLEKLLLKADHVFFKGWEDIHPMGFNKSEEDEGVYVFTGITPGIFLLCPYIEEIPYIKFPDHMPEKSRKKLMNFYENSLKRFMYVNGQNKIFLSKNVMSTGRLRSVLEIFPQAKVIYLIRNPYESLPSFISMFTAAWKAHSTDIKDDSDEARAWGYIGMEYYNYFHENKPLIPSENLVTVRYEDLVANPMSTVEKIYSQFEIPMTDTYRTALTEATNKARKYKSKHGYSLEQYGLSQNIVQDKMGDIFELYGFEITINA